eukprot:1154228-Pelagomonas_calceolata.AAC.3
MDGSKVVFTNGLPQPLAKNWIFKLAPNDQHFWLEVLSGCLIMLRCQILGGPLEKRAAGGGTHGDGCASQCRKCITSQKLHHAAI